MRGIRKREIGRRGIGSTGIVQELEGSEEGGSEREGPEGERSVQTRVAAGSNGSRGMPSMGLGLGRKFDNIIKYFNWVKFNHIFFQSGAVYKRIDN